MSEIDQEVEEIYSKYKELKSKKAGRIFLRKANKETNTSKLKFEIEKLLRTRPGRYPLVELICITDFSGELGFKYSFNHRVANDEFKVDFWSSNRWGILVQKSSSNTPELEITDDGQKVLHLPEGFKVPVGPLRFKEESMPMSEEELETEEQKALKMAKTASLRIKADQSSVRSVFKEIGGFRNYPERFFYWRPVIPENPQKIAIDFEGIKPYHMSLSLEAAPIFNSTKIIKNEDEI